MVGIAERDALAPPALGRGEIPLAAVTAEIDEADLVRRAFPGERITFAPDRRRQVIVDSWPEDVDDTRARRDWGFKPAYDLRRTFEEYLTPTITRRYAPR